MSEMMTAAKWAKELGVSEKKFKDAVKAAGIEPDAKKGVCAYYSKATATKIAKQALGHQNAKQAKA